MSNHTIDVFLEIAIYTQIFHDREWSSKSDFITRVESLLPITCIVAMTTICTVRYFSGL